MPEEVDLYCLPFAGGNAYSYRALEKLMPPGINVIALEPPGRGRRLGEPPVETIEALARDVVAAIRGSLGKPYAFFGHSMGALAAYLASRLLISEQLPPPRHLILSGKAPPHIPSREAQWHTLPLPLFIEKLSTLGGCPPAVLADRELMNYFAPIIRHDMRLVAEYDHTPGVPLTVPLTVMIGSRENTSPAEAEQWSRMATGDFRLEIYEGGHFFLFEHLPDICRLMQSRLLL
jgi:surfactin synthase thioesterase subunit